VTSINDPVEGLERVKDGSGLDVAVVSAHLRTERGESLACVIEDRYGLPVVTWSAQCTLAEECAVEIAASCGLVGAPVTATSLRAAISLVWRIHRRQVEQIDQTERLSRRLEDRKIIERAKWTLVEQLGISEPEAMRRLQKSARNSRRPLRVTAMSVLEASETLAPGDVHVA